MKLIFKPGKKIAKTAVALWLTGQAFLSNAQTVTVLSDGMKFINPQLQTAPATDLKVGATYLFSGVVSGVDACVSIDSLVNGAEVNKIDDNSNGTGYKDAFQPAVKSGNIIGLSYAVFSIKFYKAGTTTPVLVKNVNATALDLDGNNTLKEFASIDGGNGSIVSYLTSTLDISVTQPLPCVYMAQNILGIERPGIDTASLANMATVSNSDISSISVKYGSLTTVPSTATRQFSLYMKGFSYPGNTLPVKLTSFTATLNNSNKTDLKWVTSSEVNVSHFSIEKSTDGVNFTEAGVMFAYGSTTSKTNYSYSDNINADQSSVFYYRLRTVDIDGKTELSATRIVRISKQTENKVSILTYPNPVMSELRVTIPANWQNKKVSYQVFNANGQAVKRTETAASSQTEAINVSSLSKGFYIVRVSCDGETAQQKIVKN